MLLLQIRALEYWVKNLTSVSLKYLMQENAQHNNNISQDRQED